MHELAAENKRKVAVRPPPLGASPMPLAATAPSRPLRPTAIAHAPAKPTARRAAHALAAAP